MAYLSNTIVGGSLRVLNGLYADTISGDGSGLTALNASNISSGTLAKERLATSGASAGSYGPSAAVTGNEGTTMNVPYITVDTYGRITAISNKVYTSKNTTYSAGTGLSLSSTTINHSNSVTAGTAGTSSATSGSTLAVPYVTYDAQGHITATGTHTHTVSGFLTAHQTIKQDGVTGATANRYGACSTAAATAAKTVSVTTGTPALEAGLKVTVKFANANTASTPTLNVNSLGAKNIFHNGAQITTGGNKALLAGICDFVYDGTQFHLVGNYIDTNTVYTHPNSGATAGSYGPSADASPAHGDGFSVPYITVNATGHVTAASTKTITLPAGYTHPTGSGYSHIPSGGSSGQFLKWSSDGVAVWAADNNTDTKVTSTVTNPSSAATWYPIASTSSSTETNTTVKNSGIRFVSLYGTTSAEGYNRLYLGNTTATGTAGNLSGGILLYNDKGKYDAIYPHAGDTTDRTIYLPKAGGTLVAHTTDTKVGDTNKPVYIAADGTATAISYTIGKSVPSDAVFTDTVYTHPSDGGSGGTIGTSSATSGNTLAVPYVTYNDKGHVTAGGTHTHTITGFLTAHQTIKQDGVTGATANRYGACSTAAATAAKTVSVTAGTPALEAGLKVTVKFTNANTADTPTLNVNSLGAKNIFHNGAQITTGGNKALLAGVCDFIYDGTQWHLVGNYIDTDTVYTHPTTAGNKHIPSGGSSGQILKYSADGTAAWDNNVFLGTCATAADTAAKVVTCAGFVLITGAVVDVVFSNAVTVADMTLAVNSTAAKTVKYRGSNVAANVISAGQCVRFIYDGTDYIMMGNWDVWVTD